jgi:hypothetical protein
MEQSDDEDGTMGNEREKEREGRDGCEIAQAGNRTSRRSMLVVRRCFSPFVVHDQCLDAAERLGAIVKGCSLRFPAQMAWDPAAHVPVPHLVNSRCFPTCGYAEE